VVGVTVPRGKYWDPTKLQAGLQPRALSVYMNITLITQGGEILFLSFQCVDYLDEILFASIQCVDCEKSLVVVRPCSLVGLRVSIVRALPKHRGRIRYIDLPSPSQ
jgi:hypothetical protein